MDKSTTPPAPEEIVAAVESVMEELVAFREDLHRHPELSWQEFHTTEKIEAKLKAHGLERIYRPLETGLVGEVIFSAGAPFLLFRADIDALPLPDKKSVPYRSQHPGICHACGHDVHTTVMLGIAILARRLNLAGKYNLRFVFQPAEEPIPSGAPKMIQKGVLGGVTYALGMHVEPRLPLGTVVLTPGWVNLQSIRLDLILTGPGGHSARPEETADLLWLASRIIQDSYHLVYRTLDLRNSPVILTFTEIHAGEGYNVIPRELRLTGTLRLADPHKKEAFLKHFSELLSFIESSGKCRIEWSYREGAPAIYNDPDLIRTLQEGAAQNFPLSVHIDHTFRTPGADDFSYYAREVPGVMVRFGTRTEAHTAGLHEGNFDVPPEVIHLATTFFLHQIRSLQHN